MKSRSSVSLSILLAIGLVSCSVTSGPDPRSLPLPAEWKHAGAFPTASPASDLSRWWGRFGDPVLNRLISTSLEASPDIARATALVRESRARRDAEFSTLFPTVDGSASRISTSVDTDRAGRNSGTAYSAGLDAAWEVDMFGRRRSSIQAAAANLGASEENLHSVRAALAAEIAAVYTELRANQARLDVLQETIATREETARLAGWRQQAGEADMLESSQAASSLESARAGLPALHQAIAERRNELARLAGREPGAFDAMLNRREMGIPDPPRSLAIGIPADVLRQRPDIRTAGYQLLAAAASTRAAEAERYPSLRLSGSLGLDTARASNLLDPEAAAANFLAGVTSPIFDAGRIRANIEAASAVETQAVETYRATVLTALTEVENALVACRRSAERLRSLEEATRLARQSDELARQRYEAGEIDFLEVLDSQRTLLGLEDSLLATRTDRATAYIRLYQALGGGWSSPS